MILAGMAAVVPAAFAAIETGRWQVLTPDHALWDNGFDGAAIVLDDQSYALLLLRPDGDDALISVAYPGTPGQTELMSTLQMPDGGVKRLKLEGEALVPLPAPRDGFVAYGFVFEAEDIELLKAGLRWTILAGTDSHIYSLTGSRVAIEAALVKRAERANIKD
ncbi:MAG: hypothetical protein AAF281_16470 [Pseudomonadota bacterium]